MRTHTGEKPFACQESQCNSRFASAQALKTRLFIHTGERLFACDKCEAKFYCLTNLTKHSAVHCDEQPFGCNQCEKRFKLKCSLVTHLRTHLYRRDHKCKFDGCNWAFSYGKDLRRHQRIHNDVRPFKCWLCGETFRRKDNLSRHIEETHKQLKKIAKQLSNEAVEMIKGSAIDDQQPSISAAARKSNQISTKNGESESEEFSEL